VEKILYRLVQESLTNVAKHAQASRVTITIKTSKESISVAVKDNGQGFDPQAIKKPSVEPHWGLLSMQQRAASIGANLVINSTPGLGTEVVVRVNRNHYDD
jgi:two-component system sensor histidine kinase UhpB